MNLDVEERWRRSRKREQPSKAQIPEPTLLEVPGCPRWTKEAVYCCGPQGLGIQNLPNRVPAQETAQPCLDSLPSQLIRDIFD